MAGANFDYLILVASGIGITPAMATLQSYKDSRRCNLIWLCRDPSLVEFYVNDVSFGLHSWALIFYTGTRPLSISPEARKAKTTLIMKSRPNLRETILTIINENTAFEKLLVNKVQDRDRVAAEPSQLPSIGHLGSEAIVDNFDWSKKCKNWGMLYCGNAKAIDNTLEEVSKETNILYKKELFDW